MCAWHGGANWGKVCQQCTSLSNLYCHGNKIRLISWTAWHSALAGVGASNRIRDGYNECIN